MRIFLLLYIYTSPINFDCLSMMLLSIVSSKNSSIWNLLMTMTESIEKAIKFEPCQSCCLTLFCDFTLYSFYSNLDRSVQIICFNNYNHLFQIKFEMKQLLDYMIGLLIWNEISLSKSSLNRMNRCSIVFEIWIRLRLLLKGFCSFVHLNGVNICLCFLINRNEIVFDIFFVFEFQYENVRIQQPEIRMDRTRLFNDEIFSDKMLFNLTNDNRLSLTRYNILCYFQLIGQI